MLKYALCVEGLYDLFYPGTGGLPNIQTFRTVATQVRDWGYHALESVAPLIGDDEPPDKYRTVLAEVGCEFAGLHWLLAKRGGVHLTDDDAGSMSNTVDYIASLARLTHKLGGRVMVHGSPLQRTLRNHSTSYSGAMHTAVAIYKRVMDQVGSLPVFIAMEQLAREETDFLTSLADVVELIERVGHPNMSLVLDVKAMWEKCGSADAVADVIRQYGDRAVHFHANDRNKSGPGFGDVDFLPLFQALADVNWHKPHAKYGQRLVSVEPFDCAARPLATTAVESMAYMRGVEGRVSFSA